MYSGNGVASAMPFPVLQVIQQGRGEYPDKVIGNVYLLFPITL